MPSTVSRPRLALAAAALVVTGAATGCSQDTAKVNYLNSFFAGDNDSVCASITTQGGVDIAAAGAMATIANDAASLGITQADVAEYLGNRCRG